MSRSYFGLLPILGFLSGATEFGLRSSQGVRRGLSSQISPKETRLSSNNNARYQPPTSSGKVASIFPPRILSHMRYGCERFVRNYMLQMKAMSPRNRTLHSAFLDRRVDPAAPEHSKSHFRISVPSMIQDPGNVP
ncbi:hypothetical protein BDD12DRAFT_805253 [Trichophaea hybrida]|nr:hypothetical protein BDD12DRAFT_805253 [Trichophaea hybrida]